MLQDCPKSENEWCIDDVTDDERENDSQFIFVNLSENRESYTAFQGAPIWQAIYDENCHIIESIEDLKPTQDETCSEQTLLYKLMSGLHTSINTHVSDSFDDDDGF